MSNNKNKEFLNYQNDKLNNNEEACVINNYESLNNCQNINLLSETLESKKSQIQAEDIFIKILEEKIINLHEEILEIQRKEVENINSYQQEYESRKKELEKEFEILKNELQKEKESLLKEFQDKKENLNESYSRRSDSQKNEYQKTLNDLNNRKLRLEKEFQERNKNLEAEYDEKEKTLINNTNKIIEEYNSLKKSLEEEYISKNIQLSQEFEKKTLELNESFALKEQELMEEFNAKEDFLKDYEKDLEETNQKEYEKLMNKIKVAKEEFEKLMRQQRELFQEEVDLKNLEMEEELERINLSLKEKEDIINADYNEKLDNLKQSEIEFLQKENELNEKISDLNKKVTEFNESKNKFVKRHYLVKRFCEKIKKHKVKTIIFCSLLFVLSIYFGLVFEYNLFRKDFVSESITNIADLESYNNSITIHLDTSNSSFAKFTELDGLRIKNNYKYTNEHYQNLNTYLLNIGNNNYKWERYYKNDTMIAKSAFYNQYIIVEDFNKYGYVFNECEETDIFIKSFREFLSKKHNSDFKEVNRLNIEGNNSFFEYLKQALFLSSNYEYYYSLKSKSSDECNQLFKNMFKIILNCENYDSFKTEEANFQNALGYTDVLASSKDIFMSILEYSTVQDVDINIKINKGNLANIVDIYFNLSYQDETMVNPVPMGIRFTCEFEELEEGTSLDDNNFTTNAIFYESLGKK